MTDADFMRAILDNPDDNSPRLAYSDWLEEQGNVIRAQFIRIEHLDSSMSLRDFSVDITQFKEMSDPVGRILYGPLAKFGNEFVLCGGMNSRWEWRHGFVDYIKLPWLEWVRHGQKLLREHPIREARVMGLGNLLSDMIGTGRFKRCACIRIRQTYSREVIIDMPWVKHADSGIQKSDSAGQRLVKLAEYYWPKTVVTLSNGQVLGEPGVFGKVEVSDARE